MRFVFAIFAGLFVLAAALVAFAPASLVDARIASLSQGTLRATDLEGTLWKGRGTLTSPDGRFRIPIAWKLEAWKLLRGTTSIAFGTGGASGQRLQGRVEFADSRLLVQGLAARIPASLVATLAAPATVHAGGDIDVRIDALDLGLGAGTGTVVGQWRNARIAAKGIEAVDFGSLAANLAFRGNVLTGPITGTGGAVLVSGTVTIDQNRLVANARLVPAQNAPPRVLQALASLGPADASGAVTVRVERSTR